MSANDAKTKESQRKQTRYAVSEDCRLRASIQVKSSDEASAKKDWPGTMVDMSATGVHIQISMAAVAYKGDGCILKLAHSGVKTELRGTLAHYICSARHSVCGVKFDFHAPGANGPYQPFLKAIIASATLKGGATDCDRPGYHQEEYLGSGPTKLVVWRDNKPERAPAGFDFTMTRYAAALQSAGADMIQNKAAVVFRAASTAKGDPGSPLTKAQEAEARWEFSLAASNLPQALAPELRRFLRLVS